MQNEFSPMNAAELMDRVVDVYKKSFGRQIAFAAIIWAIGFAAIFVLTFVLVFVFVFMFFDGFYVMSSTRDIVGFLIVASVVVVPAVLVWQAFASAGHVLLSRQAFYGHKARLKHMGLFRVFFRVFTALLAQVILIIPFVLGAIGVFFAFVFLFDGVLAGAGVVFVLIVAFIVMGLLLFGFLVYSHIFSLSVAVAVFEQRYFFGTVSRSLQLIRGSFWKTFGVRTIWIVVGYVVTLSAQGVFTLAGTGWDSVSGTHGLGYNANEFMAFLLGFLAPIFVSILAAPLGGIMQSLIYFNQRMKKEGLDIEIKIEKLSMGQTSV
jgi:hypothetical protein